MEWNRLQEELKLLSAKVREALEARHVLRVLKSATRGNSSFMIPAGKGPAVEISKDTSAPLEDAEAPGSGRSYIAHPLPPPAPMDFLGSLFRSSASNMTAGFKTWLTGMIFPIEFHTNRIEECNKREGG